MIARWKNQLLVAAVLGAVVTIAVMSVPRPLLAQVRAALVQDVDQPARQPFQASVSINVNNFVFTNVPIPAGKRLIVEYVTIAGTAAGSGGGVQPIALLNASVAGNPSVDYYFAWTQSPIIPQQFYTNAQTKIYADSLAVGPAYSGSLPAFMAATVSISGHLITP